MHRAVVSLLCLAAIAVTLMRLPDAPRALAGAPNQVPTKAPVIEPSTIPGPPPVPTTVSGARLTITALRAYTDGIRSKTVYAGRHTDLSMAYRMVGSALSGSRWGTFSIVSRGATIFQVSQRLGGESEASITVHLASALPPGVMQLTGVVQVGKDVQSAHRTLTVLDPRGFLLQSSFREAEEVKVRTSRIESNLQAQNERYVVRVRGRTLSELGRQTGTFEVVKLSWPRIDLSQVAVQATLVSMFGTARQAKTAYSDHLGQYHLSEACGACSLTVRAAHAARKFGQMRSAYTLISGLGVHVRQTVFVRGHVLVEISTYYVGSLPSRISKALTDAATATLSKLDSIARTQQVT